MHRKPTDPLAQYLQDYRRSWEAKLPFVTTWRRCHAFTDGDHYGQWSPVYVLALKKTPAHRVRMVANRTTQLVATVQAKGVQNRPICECWPRNTTREAQNQAKVGTMLLRYIEDVANVKAAQMDYWFWVTVTGTAGYQWGWHSDSLPHPRPWIKALSPFDIYPDRIATQPHECRHITVTHRVMPDDLDNEFGPGASDGAEGGFQNDNRWRRQLSGLFNPEMDGSVVLYERQEPASAQNPQGKRVLFTNAKVLEETPLPGGRYTISIGKFYPFGQRLWGKGPVEDAIWPQVELNRTLSQAVEHRNLFVNPQWVIPKGSVAQGSPLNTPNARIEFDPTKGGPPDVKAGVPIPNSIFDLAALLERNIQSATGVHEVSQGMRPEGVDAARGLEILADQDMQKLALPVLWHESAYEQAMSGMYMMWRMYQDQAVTVQVAGHDRALVAETIVSQDLGDLQIKVIEGSGAPSRPSAQHGAIERLLAMGAIPQDKIPTMVRELLGHRTMDSITDDDSASRLLAREENQLLMDPMRAQEVRIEWWHDDIDHINALMEVMNDRDKFYNLPPEVQEGFKNHLALHAHQAAQRAQGMPLYAQQLGMAMQEPMGMQPPGPGGPEQAGPPSGPPQQGAFDGGNPQLNNADLTEGNTSSPIGEGPQ